MMMKRSMAMLALLACGYVAPARALDCSQSPLNHDEKRLLGGTENLCQSYAGNVVLVVNTASHCGYTPQYEGLEKLYNNYRSKGFVILGFPSNEFLQEWDDEQDIAKFCSANYGVSFPMYSKTKVLGGDADPFYKDLRAATGERPTWNFNKYLIGRDGKVLARFGSDVKPDSPQLLEAIDAEITKTVSPEQTAAPVVAPLPAP
ncbi:MAG: Peroxiredoxin [Nevskia sp.]|nr:Peroxiredoxin [Nevskia sp.]